jgi:hypothetical protein
VEGVEGSEGSEGSEVAATLEEAIQPIVPPVDQPVLRRRLSRMVIVCSARRGSCQLTSLTLSSRSQDLAHAVVRKIHANRPGLRFSRSSTSMTA